MRNHLPVELHGNENKMSSHLKEPRVWRELLSEEEAHLWLFIRLHLIRAVINRRQLQFLTLQRWFLGWGEESCGAALQSTSLKENQKCVV